MLLFWMETRDTAVVCRASAIGHGRPIGRAARRGRRIVGCVTVALVTIWTFVAVLNVRMATGARRNPLIAAAAWPGVVRSVSGSSPNG